MLSEAGLTAGIIRATVVRRIGETRELICNNKIGVAPGVAGFIDLKLDTAGEGSLDLVVEAFDGATLLAQGAILGLNKRPRPKSFSVHLVRSQAFTCANTVMNEPRAFHSATPLPNGEVLIFGGVIRDEVDTSFGPKDLLLTNSVEIYDPNAGSFILIEHHSLPTPRAFHTALLMDGPMEGPYDLLLVGGIASRDGERGGIGGAPVKIGGPEDALPIVPGPGGVAASSVLIRYTPWSSQPRVDSFPDPPVLKPRMLHSGAEVTFSTVAPAGGDGAESGDADGATGSARFTRGFLFVGGMGAYPKGRMSALDDLELLPDRGRTRHLGPFTLQVSRVGAMTAQLSSSTALVFGGNLDSPTTHLVREAAELIQLDDQSMESSVATLEKLSSALVHPVAHGTLTSSVDHHGVYSILLAGGLTVSTGRAKDLQSAPSALRMSQVGRKIRVRSVDTSEFESVAYHQATELNNGEVLLTGGYPASCPASFLCGSRRVYRYDPRRSDALIARERSGEDSTVELIDARMGHQVTLLANGTLLVTGGLDHDATAGRVKVLRSAEVYNPSIGNSTTDHFGRPPGEIRGQLCP